MIVYPVNIFGIYPKNEKKKCWKIKLREKKSIIYISMASDKSLKV